MNSATNSVTIVQGRPGHAWRRFVLGQQMIIVLALIALIVIFSILAPTIFPQWSNLRLIMQNASILIVVAIGAMFVLVTGGVDLSVGSVLVFSSVISALVMQHIGGDGWLPSVLGLVAAVGSGVLWGAINGAIVAWVRIPAMIVTLGTMGIALGLAYIISGGVDIRGVPALIEDWIGYGNIFFDIPVLSVIALGVAVVGAGLLNLTVFGVRTRAIGSNYDAALRSGIPVKRHLLGVYIFGGALSGLGGFLSLAQFSTTSISGNAGVSLAVITAVILGGTSVFGGVATILGTVVGIFIPSVLQNGLVVISVEPFWQQVLIGTALILAVTFDQIRRAKR